MLPADMPPEPAEVNADDAESLRVAALQTYGILDTAPEQAFDDIVELARIVCAAPVATISLVDRQWRWLKASVGVNTDPIPRADSVCDIAIYSPGRMLLVRDLHADARVRMPPVDRTGRALRFYAGMPLQDPDGRALGTLCVLDHAPRTLSETQQLGLHALARQTQHLLELRRHGLQQREWLQNRTEAAQRLEHERAELQRRHDDLKREASHDPLTGLLNRSALEKLRASPEVMARFNAKGYALAVVDIDHFKQVNDRYGHLLGDRALRAVAQVMAARIRQDDIAVRYGGEEFLLVLPVTQLSTAVEIAERIRIEVGRVALPFALSVSIGVAAGDPQRDTPEQVFDRADQALYRAKAAGRNRVFVEETQRF